MGEIANNLFQAIDVIVDEKLRKLKYDKTIVAKVLSLQTDNINYSINEYLVQFQDTKITAYSLSDIEYQPGDLVYVLIPESYVDSFLYIVGPARGITRLTAPLLDSRYSVISDSLITKKAEPTLINIHLNEQETEIYNDAQAYLSAFNVARDVSVLDKNATLESFRRGNAFVLTCKVCPYLKYANNGKCEIKITFVFKDTVTHELQEHTVAWELSLQNSRQNIILNLLKPFSLKDLNWNKENLIELSHIKNIFVKAENVSGTIQLTDLTLKGAIDTTILGDLVLSQSEQLVAINNRLNILSAEVAEIGQYGNQIAVLNTRVTNAETDIDNINIKIDNLEVGTPTLEFATESDIQELF